MDSFVSATFFRVSAKPSAAPDFPDVLLGDVKAKLADRERDTGGGRMLRLEQCVSEGQFITGEFCRKQTENIPPQAGPGGLSPIILERGQGLGHVAAFRFHRPTRVLLLQRNRQCATPNRVGVYVMMIDQAAVYEFSPILREDAIERFKDKNVRKFTVRFASPENLEALDDNGIASAKGARLLAEAFHGMNITITVGVGRERKKFLDRLKVKKEITAILGSAAYVDKLEVVASDPDEEGSGIDFLGEQLKCGERLELPQQDHAKHYQVRKAFLKKEFDARMAYLMKHFGPKSHDHSGR